MSKTLKPSYYLFENVSGQFITDDIKEAENWKKYGDPMTELYTQSQLDAQSAYIEELKAALIECHNAHEDYYIGCDQVQNLIDRQSPATSLEQVKREP